MICNYRANALVKESEEWRATLDNVQQELDEVHQEFLQTKLELQQKNIEIQLLKESAEQLSKVYSLLFLQLICYVTHNSTS